MWVNDFIIESIDPKTIINKDLEKIAEIEQDMWAREDSIWEYVKCTSCNHIDSKEDIFWSLSKDLKILTVWKIEEILELDHINCSKCGNHSETIYDRNKYIEEIRERYKIKKSVLSIIRDWDWEIRWFFDWYKSNFFDIFVNEFLKYYWDLSLNEIFTILDNKFSIDFSDDFFVSTALWMEEKYINFFTLYWLMKEFYWTVNKQYWDIDWFYESKLWTNTHAIYELTWAKKIWITENIDFLSKIKNVNTKFISDIFFHKRIATESIMRMDIWVKDFIRENKKFIRQITNADYKIWLESIAS